MLVILCASLILHSAGVSNSQIGPIQVVLRHLHKVVNIGELLCLLIDKIVAASALRGKQDRAC